MNLNQILISISFLLVFGIAGVIVLIILAAKKIKGRITRALNMSLFLITLPKKIKIKEGEAPKSEKEIIAVMEQFYSSLSNIKETKDTFIYGQPHLVFEIATPHIGEEIFFYIAMPRKYEAIIEKQIHGFYPEAAVKRVEDYNIFNPEGAVAGAYLYLAKTYALPFKTYQNLEIDPLNEIINALGKLQREGEGASIQLVIKPLLNNSWTQSGIKIAKEMQSGEDKEIINALERKISKIGFEVNIRLLVSAENQERANQILEQIESAFVQFGDPNLNQLKAINLKDRALKKLIYDFSFRLFNQKNSTILNTEELTSLFHFPISADKTPEVKITQLNE